MTAGPEDIEQRLDTFRDLCRQHGFKATPQRLEIYRQVAQTNEHPDAEVICRLVRQRMPTVSADTVYRTLAFLEQHGLIRKLSRLHGAARYDANIKRHHHFICTACGGAWDFYNDDLDRFPPPPEVQALGTVSSVHAELHGICRECRAGKCDVQQTENPNGTVSGAGQRKGTTDE